MPSKTIDQLIINSPYSEPAEHWKYDRESRLFSRVPGATPATPAFPASPNACSNIGAILSSAKITASSSASSKPLKLSSGSPRLPPPNASA